MSEPALFWDAVGKVVSQNIAATPIDLTVNAEVVKLKNATNGEYYVKYQDDTFTAFTTDPQVTYNTAEKVYVLVPQGNFSMKKMIIGRSSAQDNFTYAERQELTNFFVPQSPNWLDDTFYGAVNANLGICSCPRNKAQAIQRSYGAYYADYAFARWPADYVEPGEDYKDKWYEHFGPQIGNITDPNNFIENNTRFPTDFPSWKNVSRCDRLISTWGNTWEWLGIKAKFRTEFLSEHTKGKYGIRVEYLTRNNAYFSKIDKDGNEVVTSKDHRKYLVKTVELTFDSFNGNPYSTPIDTEQVGYFQIPKGTCVGLNRVYLFQNDNNENATDDEILATDMEVDFMPEYDDSGNLVYKVENENYTRNNIFCSEIDIRWYEKKNLLNNMFYVHITSDRGNTVCNDMPGVNGIPYVTLKAHLYYGGKDILNEDDFDVYWYRECPDYHAASWPGTKTDIHNNYIASYSDDGWAPIFRPKDMTYDDIPQGMFVSEFAPSRVDDFARPVVGDAGHEAANYELISYRELRVPKDKVPWEWYYTCVIVQKAKAEVTDNNGNVVTSKNDRATCYKYKPFEDGMGVQGFKVMRLDSKYDLTLSDPASRSDGRTDRQYMHIENLLDMDYRFNPPWPKKPWLGNWWFKAPGKLMTPFNGNVKNILGGDNGIEGNVEVTQQLGSAYVEFIVGAVDPYLVMDEENEEIEQRWGNSVRDMFIGVLHKTIAKADVDDMVVTWEGDTGFIYNYDGSVKSWFSQDGYCVTPIVTWPKGKSDYVAYRAYGPEGVEEGKEIETLDYYDAIATEDEEATQTDKYQLKTGVGHNPQCNSMLQNIYLENLESGLFRIHFSVRQEYNTTYAEGYNSFWLVAISSDGKESQPIECKINFQKDGSGANGTGWSVDIDTCVNPGSEAEENVLPYSRSRFLNPLVLFRGKDGANQVKWFNYRDGYATNGNPKYPVILRPFVYKGGDGTGTRGDKEYDISVENSQITDFFNFPAELGYWACTYWTVQFGTGVTDRDLQFNSYLNFFNLDGSGKYTPAQWIAEANCPTPKGFDWPNREGVCAYTHSADGRQGAIEIRFNENITPPDDDTKGFEFYQFIVTAQTVIYRDCEEQTEGGDYRIIPHKPGCHLVTSIWSYYPVDILLITDTTNFDINGFDPRKIDTNWPREVLYSGTGISPAFDDPADGLYFFYGSKRRLMSNGEGYIEDFPRTMAAHDLQWYPAYNLTASTQKLEYIRAGKVTLDDTHQKKIKYERPTMKIYDKTHDENGVELPEDQKVYHYEWISQKYAPIPAIQPNTLLFGLLSTDFAHRIDVSEVTEEGNPIIRTLDNDPFKGTATFFRNQVFQLSRYSNNAVNVWNGRDIMIDNDLGAVIAPTVAAGYKNPMTNDFSGVIMGIDKNQRKDGLYKAGITETASGIGNKEFAVSDNAFDNRQYLNSTLFSDYNKENPYMAGVYGYQMGVPSFGLMENGTAFFGRADGGCQIVIDGSNGVIYGGGNGYLTSPSIRDPMWNCMRITLVDNTRDAYKEKILLPEDHFLTTPEETVTGAYTSVNVYKGQDSNANEPVCPPTDNPVRLDFSEFFAGVNSEIYSPDSKYKLPSWYKQVWERATVKRNGDLPYYVNADYKCVDDLPNYNNVIIEAKGKDMDSDMVWQDEAGNSEWHVNYWDNALLAYKATSDKYAEEAEKVGVNRSTFAYGKAATTPAIEIGQHIPGLMPGILGWCAAEKIFKEFYIPGDRNFMVTYDGTMWAMNGVFMGNVIGSNIVGGRVQGVEIGIGCTVKEAYQYQHILDHCDWPPLLAPSYKWITDPRMDNVMLQNCEEGVPAFYVDKYGNAAASSMRIFGGSIDIGTFHIKGKPPLTDASSEAGKQEGGYGELLQYGMSDFVGLVHCYGNLGVGPNLKKGGGLNGGSNYGNFTQVKGQVAMGIVYAEGDTTQHEWVARALGMHTNQYGSSGGSVAPYMAAPQASVGECTTLQQTAFFGIDTSPDAPSVTDGKVYRGHFWPMAFYYSSDAADVEEVTKNGQQKVPAWFTTMNMYQADGEAVPVAQEGQAQNVRKGGNYFRVSPFGTESRFLLFKKEWSDENDIKVPSNETYYGYVGATQRLGDGGNGTATNWSLGIQTWKGTPLICNSSCETAFRSCGFFEVDSNPVQAADQTTTGGQIGPYIQDQGTMWWSGFRVGQQLGDTGRVEKVQSGLIRGFIFNGLITFGIKQGNPSAMPANINAQYPNHDAGMTMNAGGPEGQKGNWFWNKNEAVHIIQGAGDDGSAAISEIYMSKDGKLGISGKEDAWITVGKGAHSNPQGKPGLSIKKDKVVIGTEQGQIEMTQQIKFVGSYANENNQINIYARFA